MGILRAGRMEETRAAVRRMISASRHRGPDASGSAEIALGDTLLVLGHTRLSILDLSDGSRQPMHDAKTGSWLAYNGEIYNFRKLRSELQAHGVSFATSGDSEVLLRALIEWGERALDKLEGMFAFAFWDGRKRELLLARDRMGIKPLYYSARPGEFAFASEVKVLEHAGIGPLTFDQQAVDSFLAHGAVTGPRTIYKEIRELPPGHFLRVNADGDLTESEYWSLSKFLGHGRDQATEHGARKTPASFEAAVALIRQTLESAVAAHLISDVPLGVFLSGGVDSSLLALLASRHARSPITFLTVAFAEQEFSELPYARQIALSLPHPHEVVTLSGEQLRELLPLALQAMDQPTVDGINTFVISRVGAGLGLKVLLTGIGGDELFAGYSTFTKVPRLLRYGWAMQPAASALAPFAARAASRFGNPVQWRKVAESAPMRDLADAYLLQRSIRWQNPDSAIHSALTFDDRAAATDFQKIAALELQFYMRNQLLRDADVFSMANSVELRVPFLDLDLMRAAFQVPEKFHLARGVGKRITRRILSDLAGPEISRRRKMGFTFPWQKWLGRELKPTIADTLLDPQRYAALGLDFNYGKSLLAALERGDRTQSWTEVWSLFVLLNWQRQPATRPGVEYAIA